jgi:hypothetical protein
MDGLAHVEAEILSPAVAHPPDRGGADRTAHERQADARPQAVAAREDGILACEADRAAGVGGIDPQRGEQRVEVSSRVESCVRGHSGLRDGERCAS